MAASTAVQVVLLDIGKDQSTYTHDDLMTSLALHYQLLPTIDRRALCGAALACGQVG